MKYRHKLLTTDPLSMTPQLPNEFTKYGEREMDGTTYIGLIQTGQAAPLPTWFAVATFEELFEPIP